MTCIAELDDIVIFFSFLNGCFCFDHFFFPSVWVVPDGFGMKGLHQSLSYGKNVIIEG